MPTDTQKIKVGSKVRILESAVYPRIIKYDVQGEVTEIKDEKTITVKYAFKFIPLEEDFHPSVLELIC